jgi:hypothetical protein
MPKKAADNLEMLDDDEIEKISTPKNNLIIMRIPDNGILEGNMLKVSSKDALEIIANLAVQVALNA